MAPQPIGHRLNLASLPMLSMAPLVFADAQPESVTILPTYRCNAACAECCFESNPRIKHRMTREELLGLIERLPQEFPNLRYVVFSGGEITLLRDDLIAAIALLWKLGLGSRIVTNGHWGRSDKSAGWWAANLRAAGLNEMNLSTGDEHQEFVPLDSVARAALYSVRAGLITLISVEGKDNARFRTEALYQHPLINEIMSDADLIRRFIVITNVWMPFHADADIQNDTKRDTEPCDNIFDNFVVNPYGALMSCCGLTMEYIPELKVGHIQADEMRSTYAQQYADLMKLWIWLDGTKFIFDLAVERGGLNKRMISPHMCSICAQLYRDPQIRRVVAELLKENAEQIVFRATIKARMTRIPNKSMPVLPTATSASVSGGAHDHV